MSLKRRELKWPIGRALSSVSADAFMTSARTRLLPMEFENKLIFVCRLID